MKRFQPTAWLRSRVAVRSPFGDQRSRSWSLEIYGQFAPIARSFMKWSIADRYRSNRSPKHCISGMTPLSIKTITNLVTQLFPVTSSARFWWIIGPLTTTRLIQLEKY
jgi:hypothetical protein